MINHEYKIATATRTLAILEGQAKTLRAELQKLRQEVTLAQTELADARRDLATVQMDLLPAQRELDELRRSSSSLQDQLKSWQPSKLRDVNEQLVLAALTADTMAEAALSNLDELARISQRDPLTDTPNRALMLDRIENAIALARRHHTQFAIFFIDFDHFKQINDTMGHDVGDAVLQLVARRLESVVRDSDTVSRHSGDEFLVLLSEVGNIGDATSVAEKMLAVIGEPASIGEHRLNFSASIGISMYPDDGEDATTLINRADAAMYRSKRRGGDGFEVHK